MLLVPRPPSCARWVGVTPAELQQPAQIRPPASRASLGLQIDALGPPKQEPFGWSKDALNCFEIFGWKFLVMSSSLSECRRR